MQKTGSFDAGARDVCECAHCSYLRAGCLDDGSDLGLRPCELITVVQVRSGSKRPKDDCPPWVRSTPNGGHRSAGSACPFRTNTGSGQSHSMIPSARLGKTLVEALKRQPESRNGRRARSVALPPVPFLKKRLSTTHPGASGPLFSLHCCGPVTANSESSAYDRRESASGVTERPRVLVRGRRRGRFARRLWEPDRTSGVRVLS